MVQITHKKTNFTINQSSVRKLAHAIYRARFSNKIHQEFLFLTSTHNLKNEKKGTRLYTSVLLYKSGG